MFTVKLYSDGRLFLVQTKRIVIYRKNSDTLELVTGEESFFIRDPNAKPRVEDGTRETYFSHAFIENEQGATTQRVSHDMAML